MHTYTHSHTHIYSSNSTGLKFNKHQWYTRPTKKVRGKGN